MITKYTKDTLSIWFLIAGLVLAILLPAVHKIVLATGMSAELADISVYGALIIFTGGLLIYASLGTLKLEQTLTETTQLWVGLILLLILLFSAAVVTVLPGTEGVYWFGYGSKIVIISLFLIPVLISLFYKASYKLDFILSILTYGLVFLIYLPSVLQPPWGVIDWGHSIYVVNELMAPQSGNYPLVNFTAQYTSILGYFFNLSFRTLGTIDHAVWFLTILAIVVIFISLAPLIRSFPKGKRYFAVLFTVPAIFIVKLNEDSYSGSLSVLFSALPIRLIFPSIIALLLTSNLFRTSKVASSVILGLVCSVAIVNNFESGIVSTIAALVVILLLNRFQKWGHRVVLFVASILGFLALLRCTITSVYGMFRFQSLTAFVGGFGEGFGAVPMPTFGLWVFVFVFLSLGVISSALHIHFIHVDESRAHSDNSWRVAVIILFWGLFGIGMLPYYINRSVVSGQLQFILFPLFLSSAGLFLLVAQIYVRANFKKTLLIIVTLPGAISVASLIQHPSYDLAMNRLKRTESPVSESYKPITSQLKNTISQIIERYGDKKIGLFTDFGSIYTAELKIPTYMPVNNQADLSIVNGAGVLTSHVCFALRRDKNVFLITNVKLQKQASQMLTECGYIHMSEFDSDQSSYIRVFRESFSISSKP